MRGSAARRPINSAARLACCRMLGKSVSISVPMSEQVRASMGKRVAVRLTLFRFVSWDHAKLASFYWGSISEGPLATPFRTLWCFGN